ncbi:MAG TPA: hypothetical protein PKD98_26300 [Anaerolineae bacterium]|nr:hypothetical protein [Anaerolineae bacterium]
MADSVFCDEPGLSRAEKEAILTDWQRFIRSGFQPLFFTQRLYRHLVTYGGLSGYSRESFYAAHFGGSAQALLALMNQFGGDRRSLNDGTFDWLRGPSRDLNLAMSDEAGLVFEAVRYVLTELERAYAEQVTAWQQFAALAGLEPVSPPAAYQVEANTRQLLQFAIQTALRQKQPLLGLQRQLTEAVVYA